MSPSPLVREIVARLREVGCVPLRSPGSSHETWSTPAGRSFTIVVNHRSDPVSRGVFHKVRRALRDEGVEL